MSVPVPTDQIDRVARHFGSGHLVTASADGRVKVVTVDPEVVGTVLHVRGPGRGSCANVTANARVTVLFPPLEHHGFALLVDGTAVVDGEDLQVAAESAVLHRPPAHADGPPPPGS